MYEFKSSKELKSFMASQIINTAEACSILSCSRQNIDDLVRRKKLIPIKTYPRDKIFLKPDVEARL